MDYLNLVNSFMFTVPIYILLFMLVSVVLLVGIILFWIVNLQFSKVKHPPQLRFIHMSRVIFYPPALGALLSCVPALIVGAVLSFIQTSDYFDK